MIFKRRPRKIDLTALIEQYRRQRKTGRLTFTYADGFGDLYFKDGELVDAGVEQTVGAGAIFLALTLPIMTIKFDSTIQPTHRTVSESWDVLQAQVHRQLNEGQLPSELFLQDDEFETAWSRLVTTPLAARRRAAAYRAASAGAKDSIFNVVSGFFTQIAPSSAWRVATACAIIAFIVLTAVSIVALNGLREVPPAQITTDPSVGAAPTIAAPVNSNIITKPATQNVIESPAAGINNRRYDQFPAPAEMTTPVKPIEPVIQPQMAPATNNQVQAPVPTTSPATDRASGLPPATSAPPPEQMREPEPEHSRSEKSGNPEYVNDDGESDDDPDEHR